MNVFNLIGHIGLLIHAGKDIQGIVANLVQKKETFPSKAEFIALLDDAIEFLGSGLLGLPDAVVKQMTDALTTVKGSI